VHPHLTEWLMSKGYTCRFFHNFVGLREQPVTYGVCNGCDAMSDAQEADAKCADCGGEIDSRTLDYENWMYALLFPATTMAGSGLNSVSRAIDVAMFAGAEKVTVLGADCALRTTSRPPNRLDRDAHIKWLKGPATFRRDLGHARRRHRRQALGDEAGHGDHRQVLGRHEGVLR
jgi:hypothetical protein